MTIADSEAQRRDAFRLAGDMVLREVVDVDTPALGNQPRDDVAAEVVARAAVRAVVREHALEHVAEPARLRERRDLARDVEDSHVG